MKEYVHSERSMNVGDLEGSDEDGDTSSSNTIRENNKIVKESGGTIASSETRVQFDSPKAAGPLLERETAVAQRSYQVLRRTSSFIRDRVTTWVKADPDDT